MQSDHYFKTGVNVPEIDLYDQELLDQEFVTTQRKDLESLKIKIQDQQDQAEV